ncbi:hypothetical protein IHE44_0004808, partial [Lamprotornis superbus]
GNQGPIYIKAQYSLVELEQWKATVGKYKENPDNRQMVNKAITTLVEANITSGLIQGTVVGIFPSDDP